MAEDLVSIMMAIYNPNLRWLTQAVSSILAQTHENLELIMVDDCSENSREIKKIASMDERIRYYRLKENSGIAKVFNFGFKKAFGNWLTALDQDDWIFPHKLQLQLDVLKKRNYQWAYSNGFNYYEDTKLLTYWNCPPFNRAFLIKQNIIPALSAIWSKELYEKAGEYDETLGAAQDYDMWIRFSQHAQPIFCMDRFFINRWHANNLTAKHAKEGKIDLAYQKIYKKLEEREGKTRDEFLKELV